MKRIYTSYLLTYIAKKIILISGPRQSGKTTLTRMFSEDLDYIHFDDEEGRSIIKSKSWDRKKKLIIFDEIHKMPKWKQWLKGVFDTEGTTPLLVVTGSTKLDTYTKVGDSLAGRYFHYRLHPLDVRELVKLKFELSAEEIVERIMEVSGFPEPFLEGKKQFYNLWKKTHLDIILKQDLLDIEVIKNIKQIELLIDLLKTKVGSTISYTSLAEDLQVSDKTIKRWLQLLEDMYVIFKITPFSKNIARAVLKQPKYYFYDVARVKDDGARLENLVAASFLKEVQFRQDCLGEDWGLHFLAKKGAGEIDFLITKEELPHLMVEVKMSDDQPSKSFNLFHNDLTEVKKIQLVHKLNREKTFANGLEIRKLGPWLVSW
ncbi:MAG TPA: ATP-binding protein [Bacteriovoracaceae bacterium]|nr:ATP-binding protein [Bacteriovoracaceae bacterium]